ncbi:hypothetical protein [Marinactinospora rubrisoli]|uniref:Uncharacterized protein n=1 Tax=Marinactinospora rubrisoli TaxID=2715399 RepID=A0ABW2KQK6_9ACTN
MLAEIAQWIDVWAATPPRDMTAYQQLVLVGGPIAGMFAVSMVIELVVAALGRRRWLRVGATVHHPRYGLVPVVAIATEDSEAGDQWALVLRPGGEETDWVPAEELARPTPARSA